MIKDYDTKLTAKRLISSRVMHFEFELPIAKLDYIPGQFISLLLPSDGCLEVRNYSIANAPGSKKLELALGYVEGGFASEYLFNLAVGSNVKIRGPFGRLVLKPEETHQRVVLVATGTGVTPYRAMLTEISQRIHEFQQKFELILGVRTPDELLYRDEFLDLASREKNFDFHACYSRLGDKELEPFAYKGRVQEALRGLNLDATSDIIYLCGHPSMIDEVLLELKQQGFTSDKVRREKYIFTRNTIKSC